MEARTKATTLGESIRCPSAAGVLLLVAMCLSSAPLSGQSPPSPSDPSGVGELPLPYHDPARAVRILDRLRLQYPRRVDLHLDASREHSTLGIVAGTRDERLAHLREAERAARAALALDSAQAAPHFWLAVALGSQADEQGGIGRVSLAREAHREVTTALTIDPRHGGAHHVLGRLQTEAQRLGWANRLIAKGLGLGPVLRDASWESAEEHLRQAVELDPDTWVHSVELAKLLLERDEEAEGRAILEEVARRSPRHMMDEHYQRMARRLIVEEPR
jgi:tetratricopeptide (TPR) repeat protein